MSSSSSVMTFCFCPRFMFEPSLPLAYPQTRSSNIWNHFEIVRSWQYNFGHALREFLVRFSIASTLFAPLFRIECTLSPYPIARSCSFAHIFAHSSVSCSISAHSLSERSLCIFFDNFVWLRFRLEVTKGNNLPHSQVP